MKRGRLTILVVSLFLSLALIVHTLLAEGGWKRRDNVRQALTAAKNENTVLRAKAADLRAEIDALRLRPEVQESVVRRELGYIRPDEVIVEVPTAEPPAP